ncbi:MAG TPA: Ldh family oxidoreductase [Gemmataceae bacterium]|jgi:LDH2 family malate/lactate/ureidoglycolate dehydrogenase
MPVPAATVYPVDYLRTFTTAVFERLGVPPTDAAQAADVLIAADRRGIDSHGVARLKAYSDLFQLGKVQPRASVTMLRETASTAAVDGGNGLGLVVGPKANAIAIDKALAAGTGWVTVRNSTHYGIAGYYTLAAANRGLIGWSMTNAARAVVPPGGAERMLGTNPISVAFPAGDEPPVVIDFATSAVAFGKIQIKMRAGLPVPDGWIVDGDGKPTNDPTTLRGGGAMLPLGGDVERGGHKGYCLGALVDLLCGVLSGAGWGPFVPPFIIGQHVQPERSVGPGIGHFFGAMRVDAFMDPAEYRGRIDEWCRTFRAVRPAAGSAGVLVPGDPERRAEAERAAAGVPLPPPVVTDLRAVGERVGVPFE